MLEKEGLLEKDKLEIWVWIKAFRARKEQKESNEEDVDYKLGLCRLSHYRKEKRTSPP